MIEPTEAPSMFDQYVIESTKLTDAHRRTGKVSQIRSNAFHDQSPYRIRDAVGMGSLIRCDPEIDFTPLEGGL